MSEFVLVTYKCVGSDLQDLFKLYEAIEINDKVRPQKDDGYNKCYIDLAPIIASLGFTPKQYNLHGEVRNYRLEGKTLVIDYVTGYSEQKDFQKYIETRFPSIKVYYKFENYQFADYYTNDSSGVFFPNYCLESGSNTIYFKTIGEVAVSVSRLVGSYVAPSAEEISNALDEYYQGYYGDDRYSLKEYEVRDD